MNQIVGNLLCTSKCKCLSVIWNELSTFELSTFDPFHGNGYLPGL